MRIDLYNSAASQLTNDATPNPATSGQVAAPHSGSGEDRITLSSGSSSVSSLVSSAMSTPEIRADKVASLQQAISSGQYKLDPQAIAASMLDEHA